MSKSKNKFGGQRAAAADDEGRRPLKDEDEDSDSDDEVGRMGGHSAPAADGATGKGKLAQFEAAGKRGKGAPGAGDGQPVFRNKQRVLVLSSRGITHRFRHLMLDVLKLLPHSTKDSKLEGKDRPMVINEICEMRGCNGALYFEARKHKDLYLWVARTPHGPSAKFLVQNIHTMDELKFTGNHLMYSRPFLVFDSTFDSEPHLQLLKEMFQQTFGTPKNHRRSKPFVDHTLSFYVLDGHIWIRNYQCTKHEETGETALVEVGPRFCLQLHRIFAGAFQGATIYSNVDYVSPNVVRAQEKIAKSVKYAARTEAQKEAVLRKQTMPKIENPFAGVFK
jgi:ribosome biogenesis protein BRX1